MEYALAPALPQRCFITMQHTPGLQATPRRERRDWRGRDKLVSLNTQAFLEVMVNQQQEAFVYPLSTQGACAIFAFLFYHLWALGCFTARAASDELVKEEDALELFVKFETIPVFCFSHFTFSFLTSPFIILTICWQSSECFSSTNLFNLHNIPMKQVLLLSLSHR